MHPTRIRQLLFYESLLLVMQADDRLGKAILLLQRFPKSFDNRPRTMDVILLADKLCGKLEPVSKVRRAARNWSCGRRDRGADGKTKVQIHTNQAI